MNKSEKEGKRNSEKPENQLSDDEAGSENTHCNAPAYMSAIMRRQYLQQMVKNFPEKIQNRITALKNIQLEQLNLEAEFYEEIYSLEKKYHDKYQPLFNKRKEIISGEYEPPKELPKWKEVNIEFAEDQMPSSLSKNDASLNEHPSGIPNFWLTIFRNTEILSEMVQEHDEPVLKKLKDIKIKYENNKEHSYILEFYFDSNEYFTNAVLMKQYFLKATVDESYPFAFEGPEIFKCQGCNINWRKGMNLTIKTIHKKQKHKERGVVRSITKQVPNDSFFNFFNPPVIAENKDDMDEDSQGILATDFEIGHFLRSRIVPKAILYFTGDIVDDDDDEEDDYDDDEEEEEEEQASNESTSDVKTTTNKKLNPNDCSNQ